MLPLLIAASLHGAWALEATLVPMSGDPLPGEQVSLLVAVADEGRPVELDEPPALRAEQGAIVRFEGPRGPGLWSYVYRAPLEGQRDDVSVLFKNNVERHAIEMAPLASSRLEVDAVVDGRTGEGSLVTFRVRGAELPPPGELQVRASEGEVVSVTPEPGALVVTWRPDVATYPRSVPIGVRDARVPRSAPSWVVARLHSTATITDSTEPGTVVRIRVGGRTYGPVTADAQGRAAIAVDVRPGEREGEVERTDRLGNVGRSPAPLGGKRTPSLSGLVESELLAGQRAPLVHLAAVKPAGDPWDGETPACRTSLGETAPVLPTGAGRYLVLLPQAPEDQFFDLRVDCAIGEVQDSLRVPVATAQPSRLVLRPYPPEVSADFPVAQIQAFLENGLGDRLPAKGIELVADKGEVIRDSDEPATVRGEYRGYSAAPQGKDVVRARWNTPPGDGPLWALDLTVESADGQVKIHGRAIDAQGRPLEGQQLALAVAGQTGVVVTGARGWATAIVPMPSTPAPWPVSVQSGGIVRRALAFSGTQLGTDPDRADLETAVEIPILTGRLREVTIWTEPKTLTSGGETARVHVKLTDRAGNAVTDEEIRLEASSGVVTNPKQRPDGTFEATFAPPADFQKGTIRITVVGKSSEIKHSTEIEILPKEWTFAPGLHAGYLLGPPNLYAPWLGLQFDNRINPSGPPFYLRLTASVFVVSTEVEDGIGENDTLSAMVAPLSAGGLYRWDWIRRAAWLSAGVVVAPYRASITFDDGQESAFGLGLPGLSVTPGYGWRVGGGELGVETNIMFLLLKEGDFGWASLSGVVTSVGYKVLY